MNEIYGEKLEVLIRHVGVRGTDVTGIQIYYDKNCEGIDGSNEWPFIFEYGRTIVDI